MKRALLILFLCTIFLFSSESCLKCHSNTTEIDEYHPIKEFGCASCHGGNSVALTKEQAHQGIVLNPARLEHAKIFCAKCHKDIVHRVSNSLMNTQSGIVDVLRFQFKETKSVVQSSGIEELKKKKNLTLAEDHFSKLCAACHINEDESVFKTIPKRGGGCVDCHRVPRDSELNYVNSLGVKEYRGKGVKKKEYRGKGVKKVDRKEPRAKSKSDSGLFVHPKMTTKIPSSNCLKCHNRSNRIGLSYFGKFESEGYHHFKKGRIDNKIDHSRSFYNLPADVHHSKARFDCIDCHTEVGVMGDGKKHLHMEDALDIACIDCHQPNFKDATNYPLAIKLAVLNNNVPLPKRVAITKRKKTPLYNLQEINNTAVLFRKRDGKAFRVPLLQEPYHSQEFHKRLDCSACHTQWTPSCYGCHEVYFEDAKQFDWIKKRATKGQWMELRSYLRYEDNALAIGYNGKIMPAAPGCQVIMNIFDKNYSYHKGFDSLAYGAWSPHAIGKSKTCKECHNSSSALGLGQGIFKLKKDGFSFKPFFDSKASGFNFNFSIDALVDTNGKQLQSFSREKARAFNKQEIKKITNAYKCIICHDRWSDSIYKDFNKSKTLFYQKKTKCAKEIFIK